MLNFFKKSPKEGKDYIILDYNLRIRLKNLNSDLSYLASNELRLHPDEPYLRLRSFMDVEKKIKIGTFDIIDTVPIKCFLNDHDSFNYYERNHIKSIQIKRDSPTTTVYSLTPDFYNSKDDYELVIPKGKRIYFKEHEPALSVWHYKHLFIDPKETDYIIDRISYKPFLFIVDYSFLKSINIRNFKDTYVVFGTAVKYAERTVRNLILKEFLKFNDISLHNDFKLPENLFCTKIELKPYAGN